MRTLSLLSILAVVLGVLIAIGTFAVESSFSSRATIIQRVRKDAGSDLFGDAGTPVGSPQMLIINDRSAFTGEKTPGGAHIVDESYLEQKKIYPLQLKSVAYVASLVRIGAIIAACAGLLFYLSIRRRGKVKVRASTISP